MSLDKDLYIAHWYMQGLESIRSLSNTQVDSLAVVQYSFAHMNKRADYLRHDIARTDRMGRERRDFRALSRWEFLSKLNW